MGHDADELLLPRPNGMRGDYLHARKVAGESIEMNRPAVIEGDAAAAVGVGAEHGKADVKHHRFAGCLKRFPNRVELSIVRIKTLVGRMEFETEDFGIAD